MKRTLALLLTAAAITLPACGGSTHGGAIPPVGGGNPYGATSAVPVSFKIIVPAKTQSSNQRQPQYVSPSTQSAVISVSPGSGSTTVGCTTTCSGTINAPIGSDTFSVKLYDAAGGSGNILSQGSTTQSIVANTANSVNVTFNPVVAKFALDQSTLAVQAGFHFTGFVTVHGLDADGNVIVGPGVYVDASGSPVSLALTHADSPSGATGSTSFSDTNPVVSPGDTGRFFDYNGKSLYTTVFNGTVSGGAGIVVLPTTLTYIPTVVAEYAIPSAGSAEHIIVGPDMNLWFSERFSNHIGRITTSGTITEFATTNSTTAIAAGSDGNVWCGEIGGDICGIGPAGIVSETSTHPLGVTPVDMTQWGGTLWFVLGSTGGSTFASGTQSIPSTTTTYSVPTSSGVSLNAIATDGGQIYLADGGNGLIYRAFNPPPPYFQASLSSGVQPTGLAVGPDGKIWFTDTNKEVGEYSAGASDSVSYWGNGSAPGLPAASALSQLTNGSDSNVWFTDPGANAIGRFVNGSGYWEYPLVTASSIPHGIVTGPDGNVWFTEERGYIGKLVW